MYHPPPSHAPHATLAMRNAHWSPAVVLLLAAVWMWYGGHVVPPAGAGTASDTVTINADVDKEIHLSNACVGTALTVGTVTADGSAKETSSDCSITFGTNNDLAGAELRVSDASAATAPGRAAMVCVGGGCGAATIPDAQGSPLPGSISASAFSLRLASVAGLAAGVWSVNPATNFTGNFYDAADTPDLACQTAAIGDGTCRMRFAVRASGVQAPGSYQAEVLFEAFAR